MDTGIVGRRHWNAHSEVVIGKYDHTVVMPQGQSGPDTPDLGLAKPLRQRNANATHRAGPLADGLAVDFPWHAHRLSTGPV